MMDGWPGRREHDVFLSYMLHVLLGKGFFPLVVAVAVAYNKRKRGIDQETSSVLSFSSFSLF